MKITFFAKELSWPARTGATVHAGNLMRSFVQCGHQIRLITEVPVREDAAQWLDGVECEETEASPTGSDLPVSRTDGMGLLSATQLRARFERFWGTTPSIPNRLASMLRHSDCDAIVGVGLDVLPYLWPIDSNSKIVKIWYAADDPVLHAVTLMRRDGVTLKRMRYLAFVVGYLRLFRHQIDLCWVVSKAERKWMARLGGMKNIAIVQNGVDADHYSPTPASLEPYSCIFWGNLEFAPNVHALEYFVRSIWPLVLKRQPNAIFRVCGSNASGDLVQLLKSLPSIDYQGELDDLRPAITKSMVAVFPMVSGAGVKNKVLEAAAMARPVLMSSRCTGGLHLDPPPPFIIADRPEQWAEQLAKIWQDKENATEIGQASRDWVKRFHSWQYSAKCAEDSIKLRLRAKLA